MKTVQQAAAAALAGVLLLSGCTCLQAKYQPPLVPLGISVDTDGELTVSTEASIATPVGTFSVEAGASKNLKPDKDKTIVVVRHTGSGGLVDTAYEVKTNQELKGQADGPISFDIKRQHIFIDASAGGVGAIVLGTPEQIETIQRLQAFDDDMRAADSRGDSGYELDRIDPAVLEIYSRDECARTFSRPIAVPKIRVVTYSGPKSITYTAAGRGTVTIPRGYEVQIKNDLYPEFTFQYIGERNGQLTRFGECFQ